MAPNTIGCSRPKKQERMDQVLHLNSCDRCTTSTVSATGLSVWIWESHKNSAGSIWILEPSVSTQLGWAADCTDPDPRACPHLTDFSLVRYLNPSSFHPEEWLWDSLVLHLSLGFLTIRRTVHALFTAPPWCHFKLDWCQLEYLAWINLYLW